MPNDYISRETAIEVLCGHCQDIDYGEDEDTCWCMKKDRLNQIPAADVVPTPRWIPAKERLPERGCYVLACYKSCFFTEPLPVVKFLRREGEYWVSEAGWQYLQKNITHWMPLPEPPKEGGTSE